MLPGMWHHSWGDYAWSQELDFDDPGVSLPSQVFFDSMVLKKPTMFLMGVRWTDFALPLAINIKI